MEPVDRNELSDRELDTLLSAWKSPQAPSSLRSAIFPPASAPWWRSSIRVPVPVAIVLAILLVIAIWRWPVTRVNDHELVPVAELRPKIIRSSHVQN